MSGRVQHDHGWPENNRCTPADRGCNQGRERLRWLSATAILAGFAFAVAPITPVHAQGKSLTLCWAAWDPANALVELSKDFTAKSGIEMKYEFVPWTSYADRFLNELNTKSKLCDLIIADSQRIRGAPENGHYANLNESFSKEKISIDCFMP